MCTHMLPPQNLLAHDSQSAIHDITLQGIVDIPLRAAEATDPEGLALRPDIGPENARARARREACYSHILGVLKSLSDSAAAAAAPAAAAGGAASGARTPPSTAEKEAYRTRLLKVRQSLITWSLRLVYIPATNGFWRHNGNNLGISVGLMT